MRRTTNTQTDFEKAWRQVTRWLVSDVPQRIDATVAESPDSQEAAGTMRITVLVRDAVYAPQDNAQVVVKVTPPDGKAVTLRAEASLHKPSQFETAYVARQPGPYRAVATVTAADGADLGQTETGWASGPGGPRNSACWHRTGRCWNASPRPRGDRWWPPRSYRHLPHRCRLATH